jgi:hypothetical protein
MLDVLAGIDNAITVVRKLREISKNISQVEFKNLLADLSNQLADAKLNIAELKEQLAAQTMEIQMLKHTPSESREKPSVKWGCYQFEGDARLYCTACYDTKGKKILTTRIDSRHRGCPVCKATLGA